MNIYVLFDRHGRHIEPAGSPESCPLEASPERLVEELKDAQERLRLIPVDDLIGLCDAAGHAWTQRGNQAARMVVDLALGFLPLWLRRANLEMVLEQALRGDRKAMDEFVLLNPGRRHRAQPRGLLVHWVAGNVPLLGMISVVQGLLTKNASLVKVSRRNAGMLPFFLEALAQVRYRKANGEEIAGTLLTDAVRAVYIDHDDAAAAALSILADVRVAWGGREAVEAIMNLPRRFGTEDIVFGPKISLVVIGAEMLADDSGARRVAVAVARDTVALGQRGCNSPHTVFVERGGAVSPAAFAAILGEELGRAARQMPPDVTPQEAFQILSWRAEYDIRGEAWYGDGVRSSVLYSDEDSGLATPCYGRTLFVRAIDNVYEVAEFCSINTQTAGLAVGQRRLKLADALTSCGVERCPEVGLMSLYDSPWDGMYPMDRMVRWVSA
jgi:hypothetical protein